MRGVQKLIGHASLKMTAIYTHVAPEDLRRAVERAQPRERNWRRERQDTAIATATTVNEHSLLPRPTGPLSAPSIWPPLPGWRPLMLADEPCEAGFSGAGPEYAGIYLHARCFDPKLGTFLSADPIGVEGGMNQYGYGFGDSINNADPSGLDPSPTFCYPYPHCTGQGGGSGGSGGLAFGTPSGGGSIPNPITMFGCAFFGIGCGGVFGPEKPGNPGPNGGVPQQGPPQDRGAYIPNHPTGSPGGASTTGVEPPPPPPGGGGGWHPGPSTSAGFFSDPLFLLLDAVLRWIRRLRVVPTTSGSGWAGTMSSTRRASLTVPVRCPGSQPPLS